jgi:HK97 family phage portal protein
MNIIDRFLVRFGYAKMQPGAVTERVPLTMANDYRWEIDPSKLLENDALYRKIGWIFSAVNAVAEYGAGVKFSVSSMAGEEENDIPNHPFEVLLRKPNPLMSRAEFLGASFSYYQLSHNCYWWINKVGNQPAELWIIPPGQITPICDERLFISHYQYIPYTGTELSIPVDEIVHVKRFNPNNPFRGEGLYETVKYQVQQDYGALRNQAAVQTENNGAPPGILAFGASINDSEWERLKRELAEAARKMLKYMPLRGVGAGGVQWLPNALSDREMQVIEKRAFTRDELFQIIAPGYLNMMLPNATEANAKTGKATFTEYCVWPMLNAFAEKITNDLLPLYGENLTGAFDDIRTKDRVLELQEMAEYAKTHTVEEVRKKYWRDDKLGDKRDKLMPAQITPETGDGTEPEPAPMPAPVAPVAPVVPPSEAAPVESEQPDQDEAEDAEQAAEMKRWRKVARKCIERGQAVKEFKSEIIPPIEHARVSAALAGCKTLAEVDAVFTAQPAAPVQDNSALLTLAAEIREARKALAVEPTPQPIAVTVNVPERGVTVSPQGITVNVPEQAAPVVNVKAGDVHLPAPVVTVNRANKRIVDNGDGSYSVKEE